MLAVPCQSRHLELRLGLGVSLSLRPSLKLRYSDYDSVPEIQGLNPDFAGDPETRDSYSDPGSSARGAQMPNISRMPCTHPAGILLDERDVAVDQAGGGVQVGHPQRQLLRPDNLAREAPHRHRGRLRHRRCPRALPPRPQRRRARVVRVQAAGQRLVDAGGPQPQEVRHRVARHGGSARYRPGAAMEGLAGRGEAGNGGRGARWELRRRDQAPAPPPPQLST